MWWNTSTGCTNAPSQTVDTAGMMITFKRLGGSETSVFQIYMDFGGNTYIRGAKYRNNQNPQNFSSWAKLTA